MDGKSSPCSQPIPSSCELARIFEMKLSKNLLSVGDNKMLFCLRNLNLLICIIGLFVERVDRILFCFELNVSCNKLDGDPNSYYVL